MTKTSEEKEIMNRATKTLIDRGLRSNPYPSASNWNVSNGLNQREVPFLPSLEVLLEIWV